MRILAMVTIVFVVLGVATTASADKLGGGKVVRPTAHTGFWCPSVFYFDSGALTFTADGPDATVVFRARNRSTDFGTHMNQAIDNVSVVHETIYNMNFAQVDDTRFFCFFSAFADVPVFYFHDPTASDMVLRETFDTGVPGLWNLTDDAFYSTIEPGPTDLRTHDSSIVPTGGCLALGMAANTATFVTTSIRFEGLVPGEVYAVDFWWRSGSDDDFADPVPDDLEVEIFGTDTPLPVAHTSWSAIKGLYRNQP